MRKFLVVGLLLIGFFSGGQAFGNMTDEKDIGFMIHLQPYIEAPATEALLDIVAFSNEPSTIPVIFQEIKLYHGKDVTPFYTARVNSVLKSFKHTTLPTHVIKDTVFPHPLRGRKTGISQEQLYNNYGELLFSRTLTLNLNDVVNPLEYNQSIQIRAEGTFVCGGKPVSLTASAEATYMAPLEIPSPEGQLSIMSDSYNGWYRVDAHIHTDWSDGNQTIEQAAQAAFNAGLTTIVITDHGDCFDPEHSKYKGSWEEQRNYILNNTFLLPLTNGEEVTEDPEFTTSSHYLAYWLNSWVYNDLHYNYGGGELYNGDEQELVDAVNNNNPPYSFGGPAHPGLDIYPWNGMEETGMTFMEVFDAVGGLDGESLNMWDEWNAFHLNNILTGTEKFIKATANSDSHSSSDVGKYNTYFYSPYGVDSPEDFFIALKNGDVVASQTPSFGYWSLNGHPMSSVITINNGETLNFNFTHVARGYNYNYINRILIILNDGTNNPVHINVYPDENSKTSSFSIKPGDLLYPTQDGYYRISMEFRHKNLSWWLSNYSWVICQPIFFKFNQ